MKTLGMYPRQGAWVLEGFANGNGGIAGRESRGLTVELLARGIERILLAGMATDPYVRGHLGEFLEQGFDVTLIGDATAVATTACGPAGALRRDLPAHATMSTQQGHTRRS